MLDKEEIKKLYEKGEKAGHGFDHVERVHKLARRIAKEEKVDLEVMDAAALLHDIARKLEESGECECHAETGAKMAADILKEKGWPEEKIKAVSYAITVHRFSKEKKAETKEAEILQDSDRLEALGAIGVGRVLTFNGAKGITIYDPNIPPRDYYGGKDNSTAINHFYEKILKIKPESFITKTAQQIAKGRYEFIKLFLKRFKSEWEGKD